LLKGDDRIVLPTIAPGNTHVWYLYVVSIPDRDAVLQRLGDAGVGAGVHYPVPIHLQPAFKHLGYEQGSFPVAEDSAKRIVSLPIFPGITEEQQVHVAEALVRSLP
jgi:dTDP-4-amino-4,6-dideoxygalactose transaminase